MSYDLLPHLPAIRRSADPIRDIAMSPASHNAELEGTIIICNARSTSTDSTATTTAKSRSGPLLPQGPDNMRKARALHGVMLRRMGETSKSPQEIHQQQCQQEHPRQQHCHHSRYWRMGCTTCSKARVLRMRASAQPSRPHPPTLSSLLTPTCPVYTHPPPLPYLNSPSPHLLLSTPLTSS